MTRKLKPNGEVPKRILTFVFVKQGFVKRIIMSVNIPSLPNSVLSHSTAFIVLTEWTGTKMGWNGNRRHKIATPDGNFVHQPFIQSKNMHIKYAYSHLLFSFSSITMFGWFTLIPSRFSHKQWIEAGWVLETIRIMANQVITCQLSLGYQLL